jgi:hypothetical protein
MTPPPDDRTSLGWRITAMLSPEIVALGLSIVVVVLVLLGIVVVVLPRLSAS